MEDLCERNLKEFERNWVKKIFDCGRSGNDFETFLYQHSIHISISALEILSVVLETYLGVELKG